MELIYLIIVLIAIIFVVKALSKKHKPNSKPEQQEFPKIQVTFSEDQHEDDIDHKTNAKDLWIPEGQEIIVKSYKIPGGLIYVGKGLPAVNSYSIEPALINPDSPINSQNPDYNAYSFSYWPSYSSISPEARAAYLEWSSHGRATPNTPIGYVFLFFYGLERRLLYDLGNSPECKPEAEVIIREVERLLNLYGQNGSFSNYASNFLYAVKLKFGVSTTEIAKPEGIITSGYYPVELKVGLARFAINKTPIPYDWALTWLEHSENFRHSTPYTRCRREFEILFKKRYHKLFGEGMIIDPNKSKFTFEYRPASRSFSNSIKIVDDLPDLTRLNKPINKLKEISDSCIVELDAYSRFLGRNPDLTNNYQSLALLPLEVLPEISNNNLDDLKIWLNRICEQKSECIVEGKELLEKIDQSLISSKISQSQAISLAQLLSKLGYGIEPDIRFGVYKINPNEKILIFKLSEGSPITPSKEYLVASLMLYLAVIVSTADDSLTLEEENQIESHLNSLLELSKGEGQRLKIYVNWLKLTKPGVSGIKRLIGELDEKQKLTFANFLVFVASIDGYIHPKEIEVLRKIYKLFELDPEQVYSDIHNIQTVYSSEPVTILRDDENKKLGYKIPKRKESSIKDEFGISVNLDYKLIDMKLKDTVEIADILTKIFTNSEKDENLINKSRNIQNEIQEFKKIKGLDGEHSTLLKTLIERSGWERSEFEEICKELGLMPDGAIETINETAYNLFEESLIEENELLEINQKIANEFING